MFSIQAVLRVVNEGHLNQVRTANYATVSRSAKLCPCLEDPGSSMCSNSGLLVLYYMQEQNTINMTRLKLLHSECHAFSFNPMKCGLKQEMPKWAPRKGSTELSPFPPFYFD
jgi:hypothetical protein